MYVNMESRLATFATYPSTVQDITKNIKYPIDPIPENNIISKYESSLFILIPPSATPVPNIN